MGAYFDVALDHELTYEILAPTTDAKEMIAQYHQHSQRLKSKDSAGNETTMNGLILKKDDLEALLGIDAGTSPTSADKFIIMFAVSKRDIDDNVMPLNKRRLTTILAPIIGDSIQTGNLRNVFDPCPDRCNQNIIDDYNAKFPH